MSIKTYFSEDCKLDGRVAVYVPGTVDAVTEIDNTAAVEHVASTLSDVFGGATAQAASGYWKSAVHGLIAEHVTIVYSNAKTQQIDEHAADLAAVVGWIKKEMKQEAVSIEINNSLYIV